MYIGGLVKKIKIYDTKSVKFKENISSIRIK